MNEISGVCSVLNYDSMNIDELNEELNRNCETIGKYMYKLTRNYNNIGGNLNAAYYRDQRQDIYMETNFDEIEAFEYQLDKLFNDYKKIKVLIKDVRLGKLLLENKKYEEKINK
jgi:hypothetical protein